MLKINIKLDGIYEEYYDRVCEDIKARHVPGYRVLGVIEQIIEDYVELRFGSDERKRIRREYVDRIMAEPVEGSSEGLSEEPSEEVKE